MKISIELKIKSCFPERSTLEEQIDKVEEESQERKEANTYLHKAEEALHEATALVGLALLLMRENFKENCIDTTDEDIERYLQEEIIDKRYGEKQIDFAEGRD
ncbi:hypothetical protein [Natroniella sp. ANB-PHB2]|uniref:hypothetical protein n=1 Tax=Natroniella sp. ANB-PHB2 TaxID=3384444 RepID=UPI0038D4B932